jgi:hypothetical protein
MAQLPPILVAVAEALDMALLQARLREALVVAEQGELLLEELLVLQIQEEAVAEAVMFLQL